MGDGGDVLDHVYFEARCLKGADGGLTACAGTLYVDLDVVMFIAELIIN